MAYSANIFENYYMTKEAILKYPDTYSSPEYLKLLQTVKEYFDSLAWVSDDKDKLIYLYSGRGMDSTTIAGYLGMNANTYRSRVSRISTRLSGVLFHGGILSELCLGGSPADVKKLRQHIEQVLYRLVIGKELSCYMMDKIHVITANVVEEQTVTEEEKFQALFLVASFSESAINKKMSEVNPTALAIVMEELFGSENSEWSLYYKRMQTKIPHLPVPPQKVIDFCKSE